MKNFFLMIFTLGLTVPAWAGPGATFAPPSNDIIPGGPVGEAIRYGERIVTDTRKTLPDHVGNRLNCTSCHLDGGRTPNAIPWVGIWGVFPEFRSRNGRVNTLEDRVNDCFERSLNGKALASGSKEMTGILTYMWWLSRSVPVGISVEGRGLERLKNVAEPSESNGKTLFADKCASCHGLDGQGKDSPQGGYLYPPLWGENSFNIGAGMARLDNAARFIAKNMPRGQGGVLSAQEANDIAAYFTRQPRPDFKKKSEDWPLGGKPIDARY